MPIGWKWRPPIFLFCFFLFFPSAFDSLKLYFFLLFLSLLFISVSSFLPFIFPDHIHIVLFFLKWSKNWGNGIKSYPPFSQMFHPLSNGLSIQQHNQQGLKPSTKRSSSIHLDELATWDYLRKNILYTLSEWTFDLFGFFFFFFLIRTLLTCWRAYTFESLHWLISSAAAEGKEKLDDRGNLTTRLQPMAVEEIRFLSMPCHSIQTMVDTPLSCLKPAGLLCPVVVKTIRWQSEYGWNQILNQNLEKRQFRNSGRKQKQIFPTGHLRTLETRDERGQQSKEKRWRWYRRQVVSTFLPFLHLSQKRKANPQGKIFHIKTGEIIWQYTFEAHTFERIIRKIYLKKTKWKVWAVNIPAVLM